MRRRPDECHADSGGRRFLIDGHRVSGRCPSIRPLWNRPAQPERRAGPQPGGPDASLRAPGLTHRLNTGVPPATVAEWAGNGASILLSIYARCVDGRHDGLKERIERAGELPGSAAAEV